ncbi:MAG: general secretion pathway protein GspE [Phycisphaerae bacterium]
MTARSPAGERSSPSPGVPAADVVALLDTWIARAIAQGASDIHFEPGETHMRIRYRLDGLLHEVDALPRALAENIIARLKVLAGLLTYRTDIPQEGAFSRPADEQAAGSRSAVSTATSMAGRVDLDLRVATFPTIRGERAVVRLLHPVAPVSGLDGLGLAEDAVNSLRRAAEQPSGLILVTGPAGSGKSTTLYALARHILRATPGRSVVSLEDPVEQRVEGMAQIQISPHGELDYVRAMRSLLRQDVQVLLVGEVRDDQTAHIVVEASLTGHLIMSTLHSGDPAEAMVRLLEMGIAPYQLVGALSVVCSQRLLRTLCTQCQGQPPCAHCCDTGFHGRIACGQVTVLDEELRTAVLQRKSAGELRRIVNGKGRSLAADARRLIHQGRTTDSEALRVLGDLS